MKYKLNILVLNGVQLFARNYFFRSVLDTDSQNPPSTEKGHPCFDHFFNACELTNGLIDNFFNTLHNDSERFQKKEKKFGHRNLKKIEFFFHFFFLIGVKLNII